MIDRPYVERTLRRLLPRVLLADWFLFLSARIVGPYITTGSVGCDFRIYHRALELLLGGGDPWSAAVNIVGLVHFDAPPASLYPLLPFAPIDEDTAVALWLVVCALSAVFVVRRLHLGAEWLLFPPLVVGVIGGNPSVPLLALLVARWPFSGAVAVALKIYAVVPLIAEKRWRAVAGAVALFAAMFAVNPGIWLEYVRRFGEISARLAVESGGGQSALYWWPLILPTVLALVVIARYDLRAAGWLAVPGLWPGTQWHWSTLAMPIATPWLGALLALDIQGLPAVAVWLYAIAVVARARGLFPRRSVQPVQASASSVAENQVNANAVVD